MDHHTKFKKYHTSDYVIPKTKGMYANRKTKINRGNPDGSPVPSCQTYISLK